MSNLELPDLFEAAARATINERCAQAFLHDIRGSMQALFSALELLGRSAKAGADTARVEKACALARSAIKHHEKATMHVLQLLTLQHSAPDTVDVGALLGEVVHFLRNDASIKEVTIGVDAAPSLYVSAERAKLQTLLVGLVTAAIDATHAGTGMQLSAERRGTFAVVSIACEALYADLRDVGPWHDQPPLCQSQLTLLFARQFLSANGGFLENDSGTGPQAALRLYYPCSLADSRVSDTAK